MALKKIDLLRQASLVGDSLDLQQLNATEVGGVITPGNLVAITGVANATDPQGAVTLSQMETEIAALTGGAEFTALAQRVTDVEAEVDQLQIDVPANTGRLDTLELNTIPALQAEDALIRTDFAAADAQVLSDANAYTDTEIARLEATGTGVIDSRINDLINSAPGTLDTLGEIAAILGDDTQVVGSIVDMVTATNNNVADHETRIDAIESGAVVDLDNLTSRVTAIDDPTTGTVAAVVAEVDALQATIDTPTTGLVDVAADHETRIAAIESGSQAITAEKVRVVLAAGQTTIPITSGSVPNSISVIFQGLEQEEGENYSYANDTITLIQQNPSDWRDGDVVIVKFLCGPK